MCCRAASVCCAAKGLGGVSGFQQLISVPVYFLLLPRGWRLRVVLSSACSEQAAGQGRHVPPRSLIGGQRVLGPPLSGPAGLALWSSCVNFTARGLDWIWEQSLQMSCELKQFGGCVAQGRGCQDTPCREAVSAVSSATCARRRQWRVG